MPCLCDFAEARNVWQPKPSSNATVPRTLPGHEPESDPLVMWLSCTSQLHSISLTFRSYPLVDYQLLEGKVQQHDFSNLYMYCIGGTHTFVKWVNKNWECPWILWNWDSGTMTPKRQEFALTLDTTCHQILSCLLLEKLLYQKNKFQCVYLPCFINHLDLIHNLKFGERVHQEIRIWYWIQKEKNCLLTLSRAE